MSDPLEDLLMRRALAERSAKHDDPTIQRALEMVGQPLNPVRLVNDAEAAEMYRRADARGPSRKTLGFRGPKDPADPNIYINRDGAFYADATKNPSALNTLRLAALLAHEQIHNTDGEYAAYQKEADFVQSKIDHLPKGDRREARKFIDLLLRQARSFDSTPLRRK